MSKTNGNSEKDSLLPKKEAKIQRHDSSQDKDDKEEKGSELVLAFFLMILFQLGNRIFARLETFPMHNYPLFMNMLSTVVYVPISFSYIIPILLIGNSITKEQQDIPKYKFGIMGFYDSVAGIMQTFATNYISNSSTMVLVQQSAIPISMIISKFTLNAQYTKAQYLGASIVMFGIFLVLLPSFFSSETQSHTTSNSSELIWIAVMMVSCVPMCLSSVYKEQALGETEIDIIYLNGWVALFQSLFAIPLCLPSSYVINIPINQILPNMINGAKCFVGINTITDSLNGMEDHCEMAPLYVSLYLFFNVFYNFLIIIILKHGSANILWMASTVIVPFSNVAFSLKFMPGSKPLNLMDIVGLVVIMLGLVAYRFMVPMQEVLQKYFITKEEDEEDDMKERDRVSRKLSRMLSKAAERKQSKYVGLNQLESLQTFIDVRVFNETQQKSLFRSTDQIRGNLLVKLGIPPSPHISIMQTPTMGSKRTSFATPTLSATYVEETKQLRRNLSDVNSRSNTLSYSAV